MTIWFLLWTMFWAHAFAASQTYVALKRTDENGRAVGLHIFGIPLEAVVAATMLPLGYWVFTGARQGIAEEVGLGAACAYAVTWGRAIAFVAARETGADPGDPVDD